MERLGWTLYPFEAFSKTPIQVLETRYASLQPGEETRDAFSIAGRVYAIRNAGLFIDVQDDSGKMQLFCADDGLDPESQSLKSLLDLGDIVGAYGTMKRTKRGELSLHVTSLKLLSKTMAPFPDVYHGVGDPETRFRHRTLDWIANPTSREIVRFRCRIIREIRQFLETKAFLEVETPMLHPIPGGASARPFVTHHHRLDRDLYLRIAPELYLKRLLIGGISDKIFEMNRCFRNEGLSTRHNPEFTSIEIYQAYTDHDGMMDLMDQLWIHLCQALIEEPLFQASGMALHASAWPRESMASLVEKATGLNFLAFTSDQEAREALQAKNISLTHEDWGNCLLKAFEIFVEPNLIHPTHVTDFPLSVSPLAKKNPEDPRLALRFESYIKGWEMANGFSELNDPIEQKARFEAQKILRDSGAEETQEMDEPFIQALASGMPPAGGLGIGIDRLVMILGNIPSIREVIAFPTLRSENKPEAHG